MKRFSFLIFGIVFCELLPPLWSDEGIDFFEQKIRPILAEHCYSCHSNEANQKKKLQGDLFLDHKAGILAGGDSGPALVPGKSSESLILKALRYDGLEMPPSGKLADSILQDFAKWIDRGAPDPREGEKPEKARREIDIAVGKEWWSFQPLTAMHPPSGKVIDTLVLKKQEEKGILPNPPASRERLIRRAYFDLIGLPPTPQQVEAFLQSESPNAFAELVDQLLESPAYGERWSRHWLDVVRYAESNGYEFDAFRPGAYHYRDWVIRSLNSDMPYDEFVRMQIAGDLLHPERLDGAAATGFLVAGPYPGQITAKTVERIRYDQLDDMLMTIGGSMLGLTLGCVRCHEHKYDPIPHQDYYAMAAAFARTVHGPRSIDMDPTATRMALEKHHKAAEPIRAKLLEFAIKEVPTRFVTWKKKELPGQPESPRWQVFEPITFEAERSYLKELPEGLLAHDGLFNAERGTPPRGRVRRVNQEEEYHLSFTTHQKNIQSLRFDLFTDKSLPQRGPGLNNDGGFQLTEIDVTIRPLDPHSNGEVQSIRLKPLFAAFEDDKQPLANAVDGKPGTAWVVRTTAKKDNAAIFECDPPIAGLAEGTEIRIELKFRGLGFGRFRVSFSTEPNPATWAGNTTSQHLGELRSIAPAFDKGIPEKLSEAYLIALSRWMAPWDRESFDHWNAVKVHHAAQPRPKLTEVYTTQAGGQDVFFLRRGEVDNKQGKAEPGFLQVLDRGFSDVQSKASEQAQDPRMVLAQWLTDTERGAGSLLARVIVNRLWQQHFGQGIVSTPNDFGVQGQPPSHPELLEYLADQLVQHGWRLKPIHRIMMLSDVYQQSNEVQPRNRERDPSNTYQWHHRPRRLEAEAIRDALLAVGGSLDLTMYGPSVLDGSDRRSIYLRVKRSELLPVMTMFDAPEPTQSIGERLTTTVPTQALAMMNSPMIRRQAEKLYDRVAPKDSSASPAEIVKEAFRIALGRSPTEQESHNILLFVANEESESLEAAEESRTESLIQACHAILCLNEFIYID